MKFLFLMLSVLLCGVSPGQVYSQVQSGLCEDLGKFSCAPGEQDDGTGKSTRFDSDKPSGPGPAFEAHRAATFAKFQKVLIDPQNAEFKKLATSVLGLSDSPSCTSKVKTELGKCKSDVASGLVDLAKRQLLGEPYPFKTAGRGMEDLDKKYLLVDNQLFKKTLSELDQKISREIANPRVEQRIKDKVFPQVKELLIKRISRLPMAQEMKNFMIERVRGIRYGGSSCDEYGSGLNKKYQPNAHFRPDSQVFKICKGLLTEGQSDFHFASTIAHELAHSIDPCFISIGPEANLFKYKETINLEKMDDEYPIKGLISCLRSDDSIAARNFSDDDLYFPDSKAETADLKSDGSELGVSPKKVTYCDKSDQIGEAMSDWFAAEITTEYIQNNYPKLTKEQWQIGYSNVFRFGCPEEGTQFPERNVHPEWQSRINAIMLVNPNVRKKMGCVKDHSKFIYCDADNPDLLQKNSENLRKLRGDKTKEPEDHKVGPEPENGAK